MKEWLLNKTYIHKKVYLSFKVCEPPVIYIYIYIYIYVFVELNELIAFNDVVAESIR